MLVYYNYVVYYTGHTICIMPSHARVCARYGTHERFLSLYIIIIYFIALRASAAVPPLICALEADLGGTGAGGRAVAYGATGNAAGARPR